MQTNYEQLVKKFYDIHDPTTLNRQKGDAGTQYRSGIYYRSDEEKQVWHLQSGITPQSSLSLRCQAQGPCQPRLPGVSGYKSCVCGAQIAEAAKAKVPGAVTELAQLKTFYPAEAYHQQYLEKVH